MKNANLVVLAASLACSTVALPAASAQELFRARVNTVSVTTNANGGLSYSHYGNQQIIAEAAAAAGITNLNGLRLVYNYPSNDLEVVSGTNNTVIATPFTFSGGVSLSKTNGFYLESLSWVFLGTNTQAAGTLLASERLRLGTSNALTRFSLTGKLQFATPASGTNSAAIYSGNLSVGPFGHPGRGHGQHDND